MCRWDEQNALLVESHERVIKDLTEEAEAKLAVEVLAAQSLRTEKDTLVKEASEVRRSVCGACSIVCQGSTAGCERGCLLSWTCTCCASCDACVQQQQWLHA